jgi:hypothetical protein
MVDISGPLAFVAVQPCRVVDTRLVPGPHGGPALAPHVARTFKITDGPCAGIPPAVITAYSLSIGAILPPADGFLTAWAANTAPPGTSQLNYLANEVTSNAAIVPNGTDDSIHVRVNTGPTDVYFDINGYFSPGTGSQTSLSLTNNSATNPTASFVNNSPGCTKGCALRAVSHSTATASAIYAELPSGGLNSASIVGRHGPATAYPVSGSAGVRGEGDWTGVLGVSSNRGVAGSASENSSELAWGVLALLEGWEVSVPWGVFSGGDIGATGAKYFLDPHPSDPARVIAYVSLEGPEAGTYFRGRARFENGVARIAVPEHFRMVTDPEGLTVQITPIGAMATFAVMRMDLNEIVVQAPRNVEFSYLVQGIRATHKDTAPIRNSAVFMPRSRDAKIPGWLSPAQRRLLIQNGTYQEDGTVNLETARRLGWERAWAERERPIVRPPSD